MTADVRTPTNPGSDQLWSPARISERSASIIQGFGWAEHLLYRFSRDPENTFVSGGYVEATSQWNSETALSELLREFPNLLELIRGKRVLDYGCGDGFQTVALAKSGTTFVQGVDIAADRLKHGRRMAAGLSNVDFGTRAVGDFDVAISLNSFEHFPVPEQNLADLANAIRPQGKILIAFGSPWLSPCGSHMNFFTDFPWVNVFFSEKTVFNVRQLYRDDHSRSYVPDMNKMTIRKFERIVTRSGLKIENLSYRAVRNLPLVSSIPFVREFFINNVNCILTK